MHLTRGLAGVMPWTSQELDGASRRWSFAALPQPAPRAARRLPRGRHDRAKGGDVLFANNRFTLLVSDATDGASVPLVDGGSFDWVGALVSNRRAVFVATGAGSQLIALRFEPSSDIVGD